jgi:hypothetical protein
MCQGQSEQLNRLLGENTVDYHLNGTMPNVGAITSQGGTPNQKMERLANQIAYYHFVSADSKQAAQAVTSTIQNLQGQAETWGHQCIDNTDEALTISHGPIWLRAIMSLRITTQQLASRGGQYPQLEQLVLDWIEQHTSVNNLGLIPGVVQVLLPGARWKSGYDGTDEITDICHQLITTGQVVTKVGSNFWNLSVQAQDNAGAVLAQWILEKYKIGFGNATGGTLPKLQSTLVVQRYENGHVGSFPNGMPKALDPALYAWADYPNDKIQISATVGSPAPPSLGEPSGPPTTIQGIGG